MFWSVALALALLVSGAPSTASNDDPLENITLLSAYALANEGAPQIVIARYELESADAQKAVARGRILPQVSLFGQWSDNKLRYSGGELADLYGEQNYPGERYGYEFRQPLFNMSSYREIERQGALVRRFEKNLDQAEIELFQAVTDAYLKALVSDATLAQVSVELDALKQQLAEASALYDRSLLPLTQLLETQSRTQSVEADLIQAEAEATVATEGLAQLIGTRRVTLTPLKDEITLPLTFSSVARVVEAAIANSPVISAAEASVAAAAATIEREKGSWWPTIDLVFSHQYSDVGFDNLSSPPRSSDSIQLSINYPLIQGGSGRAQIRGAEADYYAAKYQLEAVRRSIEAQARSSWVQFNASTERVAAARKAFETSAISIDAARKSVRAGTAKVTDVLMALSQRTRSERDLTYAQYQSVVAWLDLELITGSAPAEVAPMLSVALMENSAKAIGSVD